MTMQEHRNYHSYKFQFGMLDVSVLFMKIQPPKCHFPLSERQRILEWTFPKSALTPIHVLYEVFPKNVPVESEVLAQNNQKLFSIRRPNMNKRTVYLLYFIILYYDTIFVDTYIQICAFYHLRSLSYTVQAMSELFSVHSQYVSDSI